MKSIQTKLIALILSVFIVALGILGGISYWISYNMLSENIAANSTSLAMSSSEHIGDWLEARKSELTVMAVSPVVLTGNKEAILPFLVAVARENKVYDSIGFASVDGAYINSTGVTGSVSDRDYFKKALHGEASISNPLIAKSTGHLVSIVAIPVKVDGKVTGVLYGAVSMEGLTKNILSIKVGKTGFAYVVQSDGLTIIHPDKDIAMKANFLQDNGITAEQKKATEQMAKGETGLATYSFNGEGRMVAFAPVPGVNWSLAVAAPTAELTGSLAYLRYVSIGTIAVVLLVVVLLVAWIARRIAKPIQELESAANQIASGDITLNRVDITSNDEIGRLGLSFAQMTANLRNLIQRILSATEQVAAASEELTANAEQSAQAANQVATSITETAAGTEQQSTATARAMELAEMIANSAQQEAANTKHAVEITRRAVAAATGGNDSVDSAIKQMNHIQVTVDDSAKVVSELGERSKEIGNIVETIANIAGQTNLLALNAAIEAARAGEYGRGFAVVADEVRKLAEDSQEAAKQITVLIEEIQAKTDSAVMVMTNGTAEVKKGTEVVNKAGEAFRNIAEQVNDIAGIAQGASEGLAGLAASSAQVLTAVKEVAAVSREISSQAQNISASTEEQSASMEEIASSSKALADMAEDLQKAVRQFKI